jgi:hypothetical protein
MQPAANVSPDTSIGATQVQYAADTVAAYLDGWSVPDGLKIAFVGLIGRDPRMRKAARRYETGNTGSVAAIWAEMDRIYKGVAARHHTAGDELAMRVSKRCVLVRIGERDAVAAVSLSGRIFQAPRNKDGASPVDEFRNCQNPGRPNDYRLVLAPHMTEGRTPEKHTEALIHGLQDILKDSYGLLSAAAASFDGLWLNLSQVNRTSLRASEAMLRDDLPGLLDAIHPAAGSALLNHKQEFRHEYDAAAHHPAGPNQPAMALARKQLWEDLAEDDAATAELLKAVRDRIRQYNYRPDRALSELFQTRMTPPDRLRTRPATIRLGSKSALEAFASSIGDGR